MLAVSLTCRKVKLMLGGALSSCPLHWECLLQGHGSTPSALSHPVPLLSLLWNSALCFFRCNAFSLANIIKISHEEAHLVHSFHLAPLVLCYIRYKGFTHTQTHRLSCTSMADAWSRLSWGNPWLQGGQCHFSRAWHFFFSLSVLSTEQMTDVICTHITLQKALWVLIDL